MGLFFRESSTSRSSLLSEKFSTWSIRKKLLTAILPPVIFIILVTGFVSNWFSSRFLNMALERSSRLQCLAQGHEIESLLERCRIDLITLSQHPASKDDLKQFLAIHKQTGGDFYRELAYIGIDSARRYFLLNVGPSVLELRPDQLSEIKPNPLIIFEQIRSLTSGQFYVSDIAETFYPLPLDKNGHTLTTVVLRMAIPCLGPEGQTDGFLILSLDVHHLRNIMSLFNSAQSPLHAFPRTPEIRYAYIFDRHGWMLFQSESVEAKGAVLSTSKIRSGLTGTIGKPGFDTAFRPDPEHESFWKMVVDVQTGNHGAITIDEKGNQTRSLTDNYYLVYTPIRFQSSPEWADRETILGLAYLDRTRLTLAAQIRQYDIMFVLTILTVIVITAVIYAVNRRITRPILDLANSVSGIDPLKPLEEILTPDWDQETTLLKNAINSMIATMADQLKEIKLKDRHIQIAGQREKIRLDEESPVAASSSLSLFKDLVGYSPMLESLKSEILKAASITADVLITGETGTGKQLTSEAIHHNSTRRNEPFITINCGALDENLLLDALFGHISGAFSDAKTDRKGAFLAANKGTLFLDEIGNASPKVQQALLRTLSAQKVKPLGSDTEVTIDVRLISATNEDLKSLIDRGVFREDLYYRLKVISITTPPLREHKEDIPALVDCFIKEASSRMHKDNIGLSRGALERLKNYNWPGNVRELKNCITRAVAMVESDVIQTEDIRLEEASEDLPITMVETSASPSKSQSRIRVREFSHGDLPDLSKRQQKAFPAILQKGGITRQEYQQLIGANLPTRTAQYDLQDLVKKGCLIKSGNGPATRYYPAIFS
jgi:two-component system, NtrC family, response regulator HydG